MTCIVQGDLYREVYRRAALVIGCTHREPIHLNCLSGGRVYSARSFIRAEKETSTH